MTAFDRAWGVVKASIDPDSGIVVDDSNGIYMGQSIQELAGFHGWEWEAVAPDHEDYDDATDEAIEWLNGNVAREGHRFDYHPHGGGLMYMPDEWYDDELGELFDFPTMIDEAQKKGSG